MIDMQSRSVNSPPMPRRPRRLSVLVILLAVACTCGCSPQLERFHVTIPSNLPSPESDVSAHQGTTHACEGTKVLLSWKIKGKGSLRATTGALYQPPSCFDPGNIPGSGMRTIDTTGQIASSCGDRAVFRLTASHTFWRRYGYCPGTGCPGADREVIVKSSFEERIGAKPDECKNEVFHVNNFRSAVNWDDHIQIGQTSVTGPVKQLLMTSERTLTVSHEGKTAVFSSKNLTSDAFQDQPMFGNWDLSLSGCQSPPAALAVTVETACKK
jgi:hypothetical protein